MRISINSNGDALRDVDAYTTFVKALKPTVLLQIENSALAQQLAADLPETMVILRRYPDPDLTSDPEKWIEDNAGFAQGGLWLNALNEPGYSQRSIDWCVKAMDAAVGRDIRLVVGNFGIGSYPPEQVELLKPILQRCAANPEKFALGLHEYFAGHIASGLGGGQEAEMVLPKTWPRGQAAKDITRWHVGRHKFICDYARANGFGAARIVITEFGADQLRDVATWQQGLIKTTPYDQIRGYHTLKEQWKAWYPFSTKAEAYHEMLVYADENLLDPMVAGACVFAWNTNPDWVQFDVSDDAELQDLMLADVVEPPPAPDLPTPGGSTITISRAEYGAMKKTARVASDTLKKMTDTQIELTATLVELTTMLDRYSK